MMNGAYVKGEMAKEILSFLVSKNEIPNIEYTLMRNRWYDDNSFGCGNLDDEDDSLFDFLVIPRVLMNEDKEEMQQDEFILRYQKRYGFDYIKFMRQYNMNFWELSSLFSILHEVGHMKDAERDIRENGWLKNNTEDGKKVDEICRLNEDEVIWGEYRNIRGERIADKNAIRLLMKYTEELVAMAKRGVCICSESELKALDEMSEEETFDEFRFAEIGVIDELFEIFEAELED